MPPLQICTSDPADLAAARAVLASADTLNGLHHRITIRSYGSGRTARIRTLLVLPSPEGHLEVRAESGTYRYLIDGKGAVDLHITSTGGTIVDVISAACTVTLTVADESAVQAYARAGRLTVEAADTATGTIEVFAGASCTARKPGGLHIHRRRTRIVAIPDAAVDDLIREVRRILPARAKDPQ